MSKLILLTSLIFFNLILTPVHAQTITPDPLPCDDLEHHPERSLLRNGYMTDFSGGLPIGWTAFVEGSTTVNEERGYGIDPPEIRVDGSGSFKAGIYQTVGGLTPGKWYHAFFATAQQVWKTDGCKGQSNQPYCVTAIQRDVGVDPYGGNNYNSSNIIWGRPTGGPTDREYGFWRTLGNAQRQNPNPGPLVSFIAKTDKATIFLRTMGTPEVGNSNTWIDAAYLAEACQQNVNGSNPNPQPTQIPTSAPTKTPAPTSRSVTSIPLYTQIPTREPQPTQYIRPSDRPASIPTQQTTPQSTQVKEVYFSIKIINPYKPYRRITEITFSAGDKIINLNKEEETLTLTLPPNYSKYQVHVQTSDNFNYIKSAKINFDRENKMILVLGNPIFLATKSLSEFVFDKIDLFVKFINILDKPFK